MSLTVSPPVRIVAILGLVAALALGAGFMLMGHSSDAVPSHVAIRHHPFGPGATKPKPATSKTQAHPKAATGAKAVTAPVVHRAPRRPAAELAALRAGLPARIAHALGRSPVVVVELTNPTSEVDAIAFAEARAGAGLAGVPFVMLNVLNQADVGQLTERFGQPLPDPGLFIYTRPAKLAFRIDGFVDKETVAQAAHNASAGLTTVTPG